ncbi:uncharacterized protein LOC134688096 [Mytilus trossulus]|uniref:uncharacterized protein LOC134688096 n=1 Tax=Mytilus trossulus TaxID=6551 RepID=UPI003005DDE7
MLLSVIFLLLTLLPASAQQCEDIETSLCDLMLNRLPEMCGDPCLAKFCKRSCGLCPLKCYTCTEVKDVTNCTTFTTCSDANDYCFTAQTFTAHFTEAYRLGCGSRQTCLQYSPISSKFRSSIEAGCCNTDKCNNKPPPLLHITPPQNYSSITTTADPSVCMNKDDDICTRLAFYLPNLCSDDCVSSKICPHMCRKCFYCLDCYEVDHPDNCTQSTACSDGKECYGLEKLGSNFKTAVQLGCIDRSLCDQLQSPSGHVFGRRDFTFTGGCCKGDKCNAHPKSQTISTTTTTTTAQPHCSNRYHRCPIGFRQHGNNCYLFGNQRVNKHEALRFCRSHCADLFYIQSNSELSAFAQYQHNGYIDVFTGLVRDHRQGWIWSHNGSPIQQSVQVNLFLNYNQHVTGQNCATANYQYSNNNGHYSLRAVPCTDLHHPFCKLEMG